MAGHRGTGLAVIAVFALKAAQPFFLMAQRASALFIGFGLAGGGQVKSLARDAHRCGDDIGGHPGDAACGQRQDRQRKEGGGRRAG